MKTEIQSLPGIQFIGWIDALKVPPRIDLKAMVNEEFYIQAYIHLIPFTGEPECRLIREKENHAYSEQTELTFRSPFVQSVSHIPSAVAIVVKDAAGQWYIIGAREQPHAVVKVERSFGVPGGDPNVYTVTVTHKALKSLIKFSR